MESADRSEADDEEDVVDWDEHVEHVDVVEHVSLEFNDSMDSDENRGELISLHLLGFVRLFCFLHSFV